ncbi:YncE family protein [Amycolatopsis albispora]|uniref:Lipoprotein n=1 Tax=Amycolatopsis albispora TaxID=1804986 RepID=A0A344L3N9_9PSEU|nr:hypothetical protein [Amycolatopsis albispora]AXB42663.1 hypothetical protein A4R43_09055 [Amycolatopsis albispora]
MRRLLVATPLVVALVLSGCGTGSDQSDDLQLVANPVAATAVPSPARTAEPAGRVLPAAPVASVAAAGGFLAVALTEPSLQLYDLADLAKPPRAVSLPAPAERLTPDGDRLLASLPGASALARVNPADGSVTTVPVAGQPAAAAPRGPQTLVAVRDRKAVDVLEGDRVTKSITGQVYSADQVLTAGNSTVVLDRLRTALFEVDLAAGTVNEGLRAGDGATNAVTDRYGRVLVTDTRAGSLLAFSAGPLLLRQRYPVPGGVYGIAYDAQRDLAWVTLTERNEVAAFDVGGGEPVERFRFPTVRQPNAVSVDPASSAVVVGSAAGEGIQVITP